MLNILEADRSAILVTGSNGYVGGMLVKLLMRSVTVSIYRWLSNKQVLELYNRCIDHWEVVEGNAFKYDHKLTVYLLGGPSQKDFSYADSSKVGYGWRLPQQLESLLCSSAFYDSKLVYLSTAWVDELKSQQESMPSQLCCYALSHLAAEQFVTERLGPLYKSVSIIRAGHIVGCHSGYLGDLDPSCRASRFNTVFRDLILNNQVLKFNDSARTKRLFCPADYLCESLILQQFEAVDHLSQHMNVTLSLEEFFNLAFTLPHFLGRSHEELFYEEAPLGLAMSSENKLFNQLNPSEIKKSIGYFVKRLVE